MKICCYFAAAPGAHPHCSIADYDEIWPVMQQSVEAQGYKLIHLTSKTDKARTDNVMRVDIDPLSVMWSREHAWVAFLKTLRDGEQGVLVEPDCVLRRPIPPLRDDADALLLSGRHNVPPGFRLAKRSALPFYEAVIEAYSKLPLETRVFHGDNVAISSLLRPARCKTPIPDWPHSWGPVRFEHREWTMYTSKLWKKAVAWNFKGGSKQVMLNMAKGIDPLNLR